MAKRLGTCPIGRYAEFKDTLAHPERTAYRNMHGMFADLAFQEWPNRASMARSIRMQEHRERRSDDWTPVQSLRLGEGY